MSAPPPAARLAFLLLLQLPPAQPVPEVLPALSLEPLLKLLGGLPALLLRLLTPLLKLLTLLLELLTLLLELLTLLLELLLAVLLLMLPALLHMLPPALALVAEELVASCWTLCFWICSLGLGWSLESAGPVLAAATSPRPCSCWLPRPRGLRTTVFPPSPAAIRALLLALVLVVPVGPSCGSADSLVWLNLQTDRWQTPRLKSRQGAWCCTTCKFALPCLWPASGLFAGELRMCAVATKSRPWLRIGMLLSSSCQFLECFSSTRAECP